MVYNFKICSYNCCSLRKNIDNVRLLTQQEFDIVFLQETFITEDRLGDLMYIEEHCESVGVGAYYSRKALESSAGWCEGGLVCLWRKNSCFSVCKIITEKNFMILEISLGLRTILLINVYCKSDIWEIRIHDEYLETLNNLEQILLNMNFDCVYYLGDFNAAPSTGRVWRNLREFMIRNNLFCFDVNYLDDSTFTYVFYGNIYYKWLDHVIGGNCQDIAVTETSVLKDVIGSDHFPIIANQQILCDTIIDDINVNNPLSDHSKMKVNWSKMALSEIQQVATNALALIDHHGDNPAVQCSTLGCRKVCHMAQLDKFYDDIVTSVAASSESIFYNN